MLAYISKGHRRGAAQRPARSAPDDKYSGRMRTATRRWGGFSTESNSLSKSGPLNFRCSQRRVLVAYGCGPLSGAPMGSYVDSTLVENETVVFTTRLHWKIYILPWIILLIGIVATALRAPVGIIALLLGIALFGVRWITRSTSEFAVTNKRVIIKVGWFSRRTIEMLLSRVESVDVIQSVFGRILGYGQIVVVGTGGSEEPFSSIAQPLEFRKAVQSQQS